MPEQEVQNQENQPIAATEKKEKEIKQISIKADHDTLSNFMEICNNAGYSYGQALKLITKSLKFELALSENPDRKLEITEYQRKTEELIDAYIFSINTAKETEERVYKAFEDRLKSKDQSITDLQDKAAKAEAAKKEAEDARTASEQSAKIAESRASSAESERDTIREAIKGIEAKCEALSTLLASQEDKIKEHDQLVADLNQAKEDLNNLRNEYDTQIVELKNQLRDAQSEIQLKDQKLESIQENADLSAQLAEQKGRELANIEYQNHLENLIRQNTRLQTLLDQQTSQSDSASAKSGKPKKADMQDDQVTFN